MKRIKRFLMVGSGLVLLSGCSSFGLCEIDVQNLLVKCTVDGTTYVGSVELDENRDRVFSKSNRDRIEGDFEDDRDY